MPIKKLPKMLRSLPDDKMAELHKKLLEGRRPRTLAKTIKNVWGLLTEENEDSLTKSIQRYREANISEVDILMHAGATRTLAVAEKRFKKNLDAIDVMQRLISIQMARIEMDHEKEVRHGLSLKTNNANVEVAADLLWKYSSVAIKVGLLRAMNEEDISKVASGAALNELEGLVVSRPKLRNHMLKFITEMVKESELDLEDAIDIESEDDGG